MKAKDDLRIDNLVLPNIPVKIVRQGNKLKITAGVYELELKELPDSSQTYPLLLLEKFVREVTTTLLQGEIECRENRAAAKKSLLLLGQEAGEAAVDGVINQIHNDMFGGEQ